MTASNIGIPGTPDRLQTWKNSIPNDGTPEDVHSEAVTPTDQTGIPFTSSNPFPVKTGDGDQVTIGAKADSAASSDTGTFSLIGLFKRLVAVVARAFTSTKDTGNSTVMTSSSGTSFLGAWFDLRSTFIPAMRLYAAQECIVVPVNIDTTANGPLTVTFNFKFSDDGSTPTVNENRPITYFGNLSNYSLKNVGNYFRASLTLSRALVGSEQIILSTDQWFVTPPPFVRLATQIVEEGNAALPNTLAFLQAFRRSTGTSVNVRADELGSLEVSLADVAVGTSGALVTTTVRDQINYVWAGGDDPNNVCTLSGTGGTAGLNTSAGQAFWKTGTGTANSIISESKNTNFYESGKEIDAEWTAHWVNIPTVNTTTAWKGLFTPGRLNGFAIGWAKNPTTNLIEKSILYRRNGVNTVVPKSQWNVDTLVGGSRSLFTKAGNIIALDTTKLNRWRVRGALLGSESWDVQIRSPDRRWITVHTFYFANETVDSIFTTFDTKICVEIIKVNEATDIEVRSGSERAGVKTFAESDATRLLNRILLNTEELRLDVEPTTQVTRTVTDGVTNGTTTFTSATANFQPIDQFAGITATGIPAGTYIAQVVSTTQVTLSAAAVGSLSGLTTVISMPVNIIASSSDGMPTSAAAWKQVRIDYSVTRNPVRIRFRKNASFDNRLVGW